LLLNWLHHNQGSTHVVVEEFIGADGTVQVTIPAGGRGKVVCRIPGRIQAFSAISDVTIPQGSKVRVLGITGNVVRVMPADNDSSDTPSWRSLDS
jgi:membrane protein implicated in regulation of membrane protease activity